MIIIIADHLYCGIVFLATGMWVSGLLLDYSLLGKAT